MSNIIYYSHYKFILQKKRREYMCKTLKKIWHKDPYTLLNEYDIDLTPPINLSELLQKIGISTISIESSKMIDDNNVLGAVFSNGENLAIFFRESDSIHRQRFTIAHELAHCCLHYSHDDIDHIEYRKDEHISSLDPDKQEKERNANIFAGKLLIPKKTLDEIYRKLLVPSLTYLSNIFNVSTKVMAERLDYLNMPYYKDVVTDKSE